MKLGRVECLARIRLSEFLDGESGRLDDVLNHLHEVTVERHALLNLRGVLDREGSALSAAEMIGEGKRGVLANLTQQAGEDADAVEQQARVGRLVDRRFDHGRVAAQALAILDPCSWAC